MLTQDQLAREIEQAVQDTKQIKKAAQAYRKRYEMLSSQPVVAEGENLRRNLHSILPPGLAPKNIGNLNHVAWPFDFIVDFDLSTTTQWPNLTSETRLVEAYQVSQESGFLFMAVQRHCNDYSDAGDLGPLTLEFRDRQSSRFFNNAPIPIQMIGQKGYPTILPTPMLLLPNAFFEITLSTHLAAGVLQNTPNGATGLISVSMSGYRYRVEDSGKVLSTIYGG
jgi:hypothetical protein